jgi:hypothetical protein
MATTATPATSGGPAPMKSRARIDPIVKKYGQSVVDFVQQLGHFFLKRRAGDPPKAPKPSDTRAEKAYWMDIIVRARRPPPAPPPFSRAAYSRCSSSPSQCLRGDKHGQFSVSKCALAAPRHAPAPAPPLPPRPLRPFARSARARGENELCVPKAR